MTDTIVILLIFGIVDLVVFVLFDRLSLIWSQFELHLKLEKLLFQIYSVSFKSLTPIHLNALTYCQKRHFFVYFFRYHYTQYYVIALTMQQTQANLTTETAIPTTQWCWWWCRRRRHSLNFNILDKDQSSLAAFFFSCLLNGPYYTCILNIDIL